MYRTPWPSTYPGLTTMPPSKVHRLSIDVLRSDSACIASVATSQGIFSLICQLAIKQTAEYIRKHGLTYEQSDELVQYVCKRTFTSPSESTIASDDRRPEKAVRGGIENTREESTNTREKTTRRKDGSGSGPSRGKATSTGTSQKAVVE